VIEIGTEVTFSARRWAVTMISEVAAAGIPCRLRPTLRRACQCGEGHGRCQTGMVHFQHKSSL
jgi:hypothetical protein